MPWACWMLSPFSKLPSLSQLGSLTYSRHYHICREVLSVGKNSLCDLGKKEGL